MKTAQNPDNWIVKLVGQEDLPRELQMTKKEICILQQAKEICRQANQLISCNEDDQTDYAWAEIYLDNIILDNTIKDYD